MIELSYITRVLDTVWGNDKNLKMETDKPKQERLQAPTKPILADRFEKQAIDLARLVDRKRKLGKGPLLNAIATWFLEQPVEEQVRIANEGMRLYAAFPGIEARSKPKQRELLGEPDGLTGTVLPKNGNSAKPKRK
jgi:hypothetical protein